MDSVCRRTLKTSLGCLLMETGFKFCENMAIETMVEIIQSLIRQIGLSSRRYCEQAGRVQPIIGDVIMAVVNMGMSLQHIEVYSKRKGRIILSPLLKASFPKRVNNLHVGKELPHPAHIPGYLPPFPDPHTFVCTPTNKKPAIEYEILREKSSNNQQCVEKALARFVAKTSDTQSYFCNSNYMNFPLIPCQAQHPAYVKALLTSDQMLQFQNEFSIPKPNPKGHGPNKKLFKYMIVKENDQKQGSDGEPIDNPYIKPVKIKLVRKKKGKKIEEKKSI